MADQSSNSQQLALPPVYTMVENTIFETHGRFRDKLDEQRKSNQLTDLTICVGKEVIRVHKVVMAANSDYFKAMLSHNESSEVQNGKVTLHDVDPEAVKTIIDFCYTGQIELTSENMSPILLVASEHQMITALDICLEIAPSKLTVDNCLNILVLCKRCNFTDLSEKAFSFCLEQFENIYQGPDLLHLDEELFKGLIADHKLNVQDEIHVFEAIIDWVRFDEVHRSGQLKALISEVRFASIKPYSLFKRNIKQLVEISTEYREIIDKAKAILLLKDHPEFLKEHVGEFKAEPRKDFSSNNLPRIISANDAMRRQLRDAERARMERWASDAERGRWLNRHVFNFGRGTVAFIKWLHPTSNGTK